MKKYVRLISFLLMLIMIMSTLFACSNQNTNEQNQTESNSTDTQKNTDTSNKEDSDTSKESSNSESVTESDSSNESAESQESNTSSTETKETEAPTESESITESITDTETNPTDENLDKFFLFSDKKYNVKVVVPDLSSTAEDIVYTKIRGVLKNITGVTVTYCSDFLAADQTHDPNEKAILIGNTNYDESIQINDDLAYGEYSLKITDNKIVFSFTSKSEGLELVDLFEKAIKTDENGTFWVARKYSISKQKFLQLRDIPKHPSRFNTLIDCNDSTSMVVAEKTTLPEFNAYCETLTKSGYTLYSSRDDINGNYFKTFTKNKLALTVYFTTYSKATRIIAGPIDDIPTKDVDTTPETHTPALILIDQGKNMDNGLGLIYKLPNGKFLIFDGGYTLNDKIFNLLKQHTPDGNEIIIAAWFISHSHGDHQQALQSFLRSHKTDVKIESILFNYTTAEQYNAVTTGADGASGLSQLNNTLSRYLDKSTKIIKPHTGQIYKYGSAEVEIMYTVEDVLPKTLDYLNTSSLVIRVKIGEHSHLILADTTHVSGDIMKNMYGSYLETEMVQLAHHGTFPGNASLYETIKAKVLIWPSNYANVIAQQTNVAVVSAIKYASDIYVANNGDTIISLPYTFINNKDIFISKIEKTDSPKQTEQNEVTELTEQTT